MLPDKNRLWCVIPAAGSGRRMQVDQPKQYLPLGEFSVIERVLDKIARVSGLDGIVAGISGDDSLWSGQRLPDRVEVATCKGGDERAHTVHNGLIALGEKFDASENDWVLVHDAVRPCVNVSDIDRLVAVCREAGQGGLLGCTLVDTLKRVDDAGKVLCTESRQHLWRAMTPQLFPLGALTDALTMTLETGRLVTDEAESMERAGASPIMVESDPRNIKITRPADLALAMQLLGLAEPSSTASL